MQHTRRTSAVTLILTCSAFCRFALAERPTKLTRNEALRLLQGEVVNMAGPHRWIAPTPKAITDTTAWDTGVTPGNNEVAIFDGTGQGDCLGGSLAAIDLDALQVDDAYEGDIGADGNPIIISADVVTYQGRGTMVYQDGNGTTDLMIVDSVNLQDAVKISGATITRMRVLSGRVDFLSTWSGTMTLLELAPRNFNGVTVDFGADTTGEVLRVLMNGGLLKGDIFNGVGSHDAVLTGGTWIADVTTDGTVVIDGATVIWNSPTTSAGVAILWGGNVHLMSGVLDARQGGNKTLSNLYLWEAGTFLYNDDKMTVTTTHRMEP